MVEYILVQEHLFLCLLFCFCVFLKHRLVGSGSQTLDGKERVVENLWEGKERYRWRENRKGERRESVGRGR